FLPKWTGIGTFKWTNWSSLNRFGIDILTPPLSQSALDFSRAKGLQDSVLLSSTVFYDLTKELSVGGNFAYDSAAVPNNFVNPQNLDFHTIQIGVGAKYRFLRQFVASLSYVHDFFLPRTVANSVFDPRDLTRSGYNYANADGDYSGGLD